MAVGFGPGFDFGFQGFPGVAFAVDQVDFLWRLRDALDEGEQVVLVRVGGVAADGVGAGADVDAFAVEL
jgi:hypothetical protein